MNADPTMWDGMGGFGMHSPWGTDGLLHMLMFRGIPLFQVVVAAVMAGRVWKARGVLGANPLPIIRKRYARGEIDAEELEERQRKLGR
ncbi:MAG TPA: SHOCT domain-containing protein [Gammaproteobacteria bacterium]|nr:SHOCT domain-containing protein [Gammaproteobacteria bacterium]